MTIKVNFMYQEQVWSLYNKTFNMGTILFALLLPLAYSMSEANDTKYVFIVLALVYLIFIIKTIRIFLRNRKFKKQGTKCKGIIVDKVVKRGYSRKSGDHYSLVSLLVEYENPRTGEKKSFVTPYVNGCPFTYLSSLDVTVYEMPDGSAWATDFKRIKSLKDAVKYKK